MAESKNEPSKFQQTIDKELSEIYDNLQKKTGFSDEKMKKFADRVYQSQVFGNKCSTVFPGNINFFFL
jgi:hypothetical protein